MTAKEIINQLCKDYMVTQKEIAEELGISSNSLSRSINGDMKLSTFVKIVKEIGATIVVQSDEDLELN